MHKVLFYILLFIVTSTTLAQETKRPKVGLVLSGGGAKGFAHIGVLKIIEEAGLEVDFIGGTSIGAIIGVMYSIGYSAEAIEKIVFDEDWSSLLIDAIPRKYMAANEKGLPEKYFIYFPLNKGKIQLPAGLQEGQNICKKFTKLTSPVYQQKDFLKFQTPFMCIGADIMSGNYVVMNKGSLPQAMRASMAIPSFFTPVEYDGHLMVDGGLINNFPVEEVKKMGADIIIGVDVQNKPYKKEEVNSLFKVISQISYLFRKNQGIKNKSMTDIYIHPDLKGYSVTSFKSADTLIKRGENAARLVFDEISNLADSLNRIKFKHMKRRMVQPLKSVLVNDITVINNKHLSKEFIKGVLNLKVNRTISFKELEQAIDRAYGTGFFEKIIYYFDFDKETSHNTMVVKVFEAKHTHIGIGVSYDSDFKASFNLNATVRNLLYENSKFTLDFSLGDSPAVYTNYFINRGNKPGLGFKFSAELYDLRLYNIANNENNKNDTDGSNGLINQNLKYQLSLIKPNIYTKSIINNLTLETGIEFELQGLSESIGFLGFKSSYDSYANAYFRLHVDEFNSFEYPTKGFKFNALVKYIHPINKDWRELKGVIARFDFNSILPLTDKFVLSRALHAGYTIGDQVPDLSTFFYTYKTVNSFSGSIPFVGVKYMSQYGKYSAVVKLDLQYEIFSNNYISLLSNMGKLSVNVQDFTNVSRDLTFGYGVSYGIKTFIGPIEFAIMSNNKNNQSIFYHFTIGRRLQ